MSQIIEEKFEGLSHKEAAGRLKRDGYNELQTKKSKKILELAIEIIKEPMIFLLLTCGAIYFFLGDKKEAGILMISVLGVVAISLYQERKTEKSLEALRNLSSPIALVIRQGVHRRIPGREVVAGDILLLAEGDRVPADAIILEGTNLFVDESLLTGESAAVEKFSEPGNTADEANRNSVFSGTLVVKGHGYAEVVATGSNTELGRIGKSLHSLNIEKTLLQKEVAKVIRNVAIIGISLCLLLIIFYAATRGDIINGFLAGLTMAMGILPEEFPIVLTLFLTMGAWRLAQKKVLARRAATIETLGSANVLCVDKTGTLTENKMKIQEMYCGTGAEESVDERRLLEVGILACQKKPFDPLEIAFFDKSKEDFWQEGVYAGLELVREYPLEKDSLSVVNAWQKEDGKYLLAAKGAPEAIMDLAKLPKKQAEMLHEKVRDMAKSGLRVIAVAVSGDNKALPKEKEGAEYEFIGLVGMADPIRPEVKGCIEECYGAGIKVIMITGDYPVTAENIAAKIGLESPGGVITGKELEGMTETQLQIRLKNVSIFARIAPEQKLMIVEALKKDGYVVAMTGDGVNDAPALKSAHIGIAMGMRGTDVAREAAALVLLDDNFSSIVGGVKLGRRIYGNLKKAMSYIFSIHVPIAGLSLLPVLFKWPLVLLPIHIVFLELVIDPACTIAFEAERAEDNIMAEPPRKIREPIFGKKMIFFSLFQGAIILATTLFAYKYALDLGWTVEKARAMTFLILIVSNVSLILADLSGRELIIKKIATSRNLSLFLVIIATLTMLFLALTHPFLVELFKFDLISRTEILMGVLAGVLSVLWFEILKFAFPQNK